MIRSNTDELSAENKDAEELLTVLENETMQAVAEGRPLEDFMVVQDLPPDVVAQVPSLKGLGPSTPWDVPPMDPQTGQAAWPLQVPPVLETHNDVLHLRKHADLANSPAATSNQKLMQLLHAHISWHLLNLKTKDPELATVLGQPVAAPMLPDGAPQPGGPQAGPSQSKQKQNGQQKGPNGVQAVRQVKVPPEGQIPAGAGV